jgi:hypothetical protein
MSRAEVAVPEVVAVRKKESDDLTHYHVDLIGYRSEHIATEPIMISIERAQSLMLYDRLWIATPEGESDIVKGKCSVCGHEPYLRTAADAEDEEKLLALPEM